VLRDQLDALGDGVPVKGLEGQDLQDQHVERALRDWESGWRHFRVTSTFDCINLRGIKVGDGPVIRQEESGPPPRRSVS
jgi:hypothetical protein